MKRQVRDSGSKPDSRQALQLKLAVAVGEVGEHEERQPVADRLVEGAEDARLVHVPGVAREQLLRLFAAIAPEVRVQQVHHGPQVAAFLDIHLEQVAQIVERRAAVAEQMLLLDRCRFGVALRDDDAPELRAQLARHLLPHRLAEIVAEADRALGHRFGEENAPAVVGHLHAAVACPALRIHAGGGAQVNIRSGEVARTHLPPPVQEPGLPMLQGSLQRAVVGEVDVVGDSLRVVDAHVIVPLKPWATRTSPCFPCRRPSARRARRPR